MTITGERFGKTSEDAKVTIGDFACRSSGSHSLEANGKHSIVCEVPPAPEATTVVTASAWVTQLARIARLGTASMNWARDG